jgi:hypothetical protein
LFKASTFIVKKYLFCFLCVALFFYKAEAQSISSADVVVLRDKIVKVGTGLLGTTEATGRNDGAVVEKILNSVGLNKGDPYCAAFNYWCYTEAGGAKFVPRSGWSPDWVKSPTWTRTSGGLNPKPGDSFGIFFKSKNRVAHTGLVKKWGDTSLVTLEGNTSPDAEAGSAADRDGGGVWSKRRLKIQIYAVRNWLD